MPDRDNLMDVAAALAIVGAAILAFSLIFPAKARAAQFSLLPGKALTPIPSSPGFAVSDQATELNTDIAATSLTTGGGGGDYQPNGAFIATLDQSLFSGINTQNFAHWFPGWQALPPNSTDTVSIPMTATVLQTYGQALALAQSQEQELEGEDFSNIEATLSDTTDLLTATQAVGEAVLQNNKEQQYVRQLLATLITVETTRAAEELNERAQESATNAMSFNLGVAP
jgi:hypothetical protein